MEETVVTVLGAKVDWATEPTPVFADFVTVAFGIDQFAVVFCCTRPEGTPDKDGKVPTRVVASIRLTATTFAQLQEAMGQIRKTWEAQNKQIADGVRAAMGKAK